MKIQWVRSTIRCPERQRRIVEGLGLKRLGQIREVRDHPAIRGMVAKIPHLVRIIDQEKPADS